LDKLLARLLVPTTWEGRPTSVWYHPFGRCRTRLIQNATGRP
jgi:hypothetical protein